MTKFKKYCTHCGEELIQEDDVLFNWIKDKNLLERYDSETGEKKEYRGVRYYCPNYKWYNFTNHDNYFIEN